jgi:serine/threonine protein phosphatase 1
MLSWLRPLRFPGSYPSAPRGLAIYAIGDVHGRADCLANAQSMIDRDMLAQGNRDHAVEIYLGDYIDRGPDSKSVIDLLIKRASETETVFLRGNHEGLMEAFLRGRAPFENWRAVGGLETVLSYGVDARSLLVGAGTVLPQDLALKLPVAHLRFFDRLENIRVVGSYCFVHAGIRPRIALENQTIEDLTWIRDEFLNFAGDFGFVVVHGHTPVAAVDLLPNRVNIDTGAYVTNHLSVIRIDADGLAILENPSE